MSYERDMMDALAEAISSHEGWPEGAPVLVERPGDIAYEIEAALGKVGLCAVVVEPDNIESVDGAGDFIARSDWTIAVFAEPTTNSTGVGCLEASGLVRQILADQNPGGLWAEPLSRCRIRNAGQREGVHAREVTFSAAYLPVK